MTFLFHRSDDALDVLTRPGGDGGAQISVRKAVESTGEDPVEGVHENFHSVLHGVVEGFGRAVLRGFGDLDSRLVFVPLSHQVFKQGRHHALAVFSQPEFALDGRSMVSPFARRIGLSRVDASGVADVVSDHDGRVHALEVKDRNPRMQARFNIVDIPSGDLALLCFG